MSTLFAMKGSKASTFHGAHSSKPLEIRGTWHMQGPQPISNSGGVPLWVADLFDARPDLMQVALSTEQGGVVWSRMVPE